MREVPTRPTTTHGPWTLHSIWHVDKSRPDGSFDLFRYEARCGDQVVRQTEEDSFYGFFDRLDRLTEAMTAPAAWEALPLFAGVEA